VLSCIAFACCLLASNEWVVQYTRFGDEYTQKNMWNAGRMNLRAQIRDDKGSIWSDATWSFSLGEVQFGDPKENTDNFQPIVWSAYINCRDGSENGGNCINVTDHMRGDSVEGASRYEIYFNTKDDAVAFVRYFRK